MAKQINEEQIELLIERLIDRINKANTTFLKSIGSSIKQIRKLTPSQAHQLVQMLKYGGSYDDLVRQIAKYTNLNIQDIDDIFSSYAKKDQLFYEKFYEYKDIPFTPFEQNMALKRQTQALANITKQAMYNFTQSNAIGYTINGKFFNLRNTYEKLLDEALLNVSQGKETFDQAMSGILKDIGGSGLKYLDYENGKQIRLDSMTRQYLKDGLRNLHNENQKLIGEEFGSDGVEISVHNNPAPDHELVQGRQFSNEEFNKFQNDMDAVSYDGILFPAISDETGHDRRSISEYNCYHTIFPIILGVSEPEYSNEQLQQIIDDNNKGFELDGKHYTNYEGTQMQRKLESKIREQKDIQILASSSDTKELVGKCQENIRVLTDKYKQLSETSGLPTKMERMKVSGYKRINIKNVVKDNFDRPLDNIDDIAKYVKSRKDELYGLNEKENQLKLNEKYGFNNKPTLIDEKTFDNLDDNFNYNKPEEMKDNQYAKLYRGWDNKKYYDDYINVNSKDFKYGEGGDADGVGTYATDNEWTSMQYAKENEDLLMEIAIPNNAKFISKEKLVDLHYKIYDDFNKNRELYRNKYGDKVIGILDTMNNNISSTAVLNGYEIMYNNQWQNWVILNRSIVKIKKK